MPPNSESQDQTHQQFLQEAIGLLQQVDQDLQALQTASDPSPVLDRLVHSAHLLRCGGAYFHLPSVEILAYRFRGVLKALQDQATDLRAEWVEALVQISACLQQLRVAYTQAEPPDAAQFLAEAQPIFAALETQLSAAYGGHFARMAQRDQDLVQQICVTELPQVLERLETCLQQLDPTFEQIQRYLQSLLGFGEFLALPKLVVIARAALVALQADPDTALEVGQLTLNSCREAQATLLSKAGTAAEGTAVEGVNLAQLLVQAQDVSGAVSPVLYFLADATDWLDAMERDLLHLTERDNLLLMHSLMRTTHTLKGAAVGAHLETIVSLARSLEDIFRSLCDPGTVLDASLKGLLFQIYECLRLSVSVQLTHPGIEEAEVLRRANAIFAQIREQLGDRFDPETTLPTAMNLGVDVVQSVFQDDVEQRLQTLRTALQQFDRQLAATLSQQMEVLIGIAESFDLEGFKTIAQVTMQALDRYPDQAPLITEFALADFQQGQALVLAGDRTRGGAPSFGLRYLAEGNEPTHQLTIVSAGGANTVQTIRVAVEQLERLTQLTGVFLTSQKQQQSAHGQLYHHLEDLQTRCQQHLQQLHQLGEEAENAASREQEQSCLEQFRATVVDAAQLEEQLTTALQQQQQAGQTLKLQRQLLKDVRHQVLETQVTPLDPLFRRLTQMIEQLAAAENKPAKLTLSGAEVLVEQVVAEQLYDPLLHLLRNAFDHGIDAPEVRRQLGKPGVAQIQLRAYLQERRTVIEVSDDGPGLNFAQIRERAIQQQLLSADEASLRTESELQALLFTPGFSTRSQVTDLSGRGVGLDVVQTQVQAMGGTVAVKTRSQQGTTVALKIPRTLTLSDAAPSSPTANLPCPSPVEPSISSDVPSLDDLFGNLESAATSMSAEPVLSSQPRTQPVNLPQPQRATSLRPNPNPAQNVVSLRPHPFAQQNNQGFDASQLFIWSAKTTVFTIPYDSIEENVMPKVGQVTQTQRQQFLQWRGQSLPLYFLADMLDPSAWGLSSAPTVQGQTILRLVLRAGQQVLAIESTIDHLINGHQFTIEPLNNPVSHPQSVQGQTILADGSSAVVIDVIALLRENVSLTEPSDNRYRPLNLVEPATRASLARSASPGTILVIDDSKMVREALKTTLQSAHYSVLEAKDGQDAVNLAQTATAPIHAVICDVAMPRMNGLDFLRCCRQYPLYANVPIMMLSSCSSEVHQQIALDLGATAYFQKPYADQQLLSAVRTLIRQESLI
jgi:chemotaxis protein histidine kinase CheA/ActR/RegA family two-component response regulator